MATVLPNYQKTGTTGEKILLSGKSYDDIIQRTPDNPNTVFLLIMHAFPQGVVSSQGVHFVKGVKVITLLMYKAQMHIHQQIHSVWYHTIPPGEAQGGKHF